MARVSCHWCYGLAIPTTLLIIAARAWPRVKRAFRFVAMICVRKKAGALVVGRTEKSGSECGSLVARGPASAAVGTPAAAAAKVSSAARSRLPQVPHEVWALVRQYIIDDLYSQEEDRFVFRTHVRCNDELWEELTEHAASEAGFSDRPVCARLTLEHIFK
ncbi:hypothetical protein JCM8202_001244 [Rhodotorula sphaerocarpa]